MFVELISHNSAPVASRVRQRRAPVRTRLITTSHRRRTQKDCSCQQHVLAWGFKFTKLCATKHPFRGNGEVGTTAGYVSFAVHCTLHAIWEEEPVTGVGRREECYQRTTLRTTRLHLPNIAPWILQGERETFPLSSCGQHITRRCFDPFEDGRLESFNAATLSQTWCLKLTLLHAGQLHGQKRRSNLSNFNVSVALLLHKHAHKWKTPNECLLPILWRHGNRHIPQLFTAVSMLPRL